MALKIVSASATLADVLSIVPNEKEMDSLPYDSKKSEGYFKKGWTNSTSKSQYIDRLISNRKPVVSGKHKYDQPRVVKPVKSLNNRRGVPIRSLYLEGKDECLIGKAPSVAKDILFTFNPACSSGCDNDDFTLLAEVVIDAWDTLIEAGYSPQFALLCGARYSDKDIVVRVDCPGIDREQIRHMISDMDSCRYLYFKAEDYFTPIHDIKREDLMKDLYDQSKGRPVTLTKEHLLAANMNPQRTVGSFVGLRSDRVKECVAEAKQQLQDGMLAL